MRALAPLRGKSLGSALLLLLHGFSQLSFALDAPLKTEWTDEVNSDPNPWPEYPRPQMVREKWLNLNGQWDYMGGESLANPADNPDLLPDFPPNPEHIKVPFPPESYLSGIMRRLETNMWYRRTFTVPDDWADNSRILLRFDAVAVHASVYINGKPAGGHTGRWDSWDLDITDLLVSGDNTVVVGANDPHDGKSSCGKGAVDVGDYTFTSGIWQTVWIEPVPESSLRQLKITPNLGDANVGITVRAEGSETKISVSVSSDGQEVNTATGESGTEITVPVPDPRSWSPNDPHLYDLKVQLLDGSGAVIDEVTSYFGMRSIALGEANGKKIPILNGEFVFQYGPLDQGYWPDGIHTPPSDDAIKSEFTSMKDLGFNLMRKHAKAEPQRWYYWADKLGMLVWQDMPSLWFPDDAPDVQKQFEQEWAVLIDQHHNAPSIVVWVPFNENWGAYDVVRITDWTKSLDPTRLVNGNSGYNNAPGYRPAPGDPGNGDFDDLHIYIGPGGAAQPSDTRAAALGEYGGVGLLVDGSMWPGVDHNAYEMQPSVDALTTRFVDMQAELKKLVQETGLGAAVYTQLTDVEHEVNGFLTYDRKVRKVDFDRVKPAVVDVIGAKPNASARRVPAKGPVRGL
ncbi:hypothetical protein N3K66_001470 [Trichothecium roseum]|uniref:Uncharacterized protein n=1 Tax=Trichothecium roseum TaxID=47278 RepID=A0ACC0VGC0_9HYPO|nr:hypothetical protein N3K66_001470 [Trichothecium roseum]